MSGQQRSVDVEGMQQRMDAIRLKQMLGGSLSEQELMCLQIEEHGFGCGTCSSGAAASTPAPELP
jgi:hypothetical protein